MKNAISGLFTGGLVACAFMSGFIHIWLWIFLSYAIPILVFSLFISTFRKDFSWFREDGLMFLHAIAPLLGYGLSFLVDGGGGASDLLNPPVWVRWVIGIPSAIVGTLIGLGIALPPEPDFSDMPPVRPNERLLDEDY